MPLHTCKSCGCHVRADDHTCPHCGASMCSGLCVSKTAAALLLGLAAGCNGFVGQPKYGAGPTDSADTAVDADADGYTVAGGDCDDDDPDVHPDATETTGDGIDSNCDGEDDT